MPRFTPPTYKTRFAPEPGAVANRDLMRWYGFPTGYSVLIVGGEVTPYPGRSVPTIKEINEADSGSGYGDRAAFLGGRTWEVTVEEQALLEAAGYTVEV